MTPKWMSSDLVQTCFAIATVVLLSCGLGWMVLKLQPTGENALPDNVAIESVAIKNEDRVAGTEKARSQNGLAKNDGGQLKTESDVGVVKFYAGKNQDTAILLPSKQQSKSFTIVNVFPTTNSSLKSATNSERDNNDTF